MKAVRDAISEPGVLNGISTANHTWRPLIWIKTVTKPGTRENRTATGTNRNPKIKECIDGRSMFRPTSVNILIDHVSYQYRQSQITTMTTAETMTTTAETRNQKHNQTFMSLVQEHNVPYKLKPVTWFDATKAIFYNGINGIDYFVIHDTRDNQLIVQHI